jgi:hypothetical protein
MLPLSHIYPNKSSWKSAFVDFIASETWHYFLTIPVGSCPHDDEVVRRLRLIEAMLTSQHVSRRYHKLPDEARYRFIVAFEGERICGTRHAHILAYIPLARKNSFSQASTVAFFPMEFRFLWDNVLGSGSDSSPKFALATTSNKIYTVKNVEEDSRFEFVSPPQTQKIFCNDNLRITRNRDAQKRQSLGLIQD